MGVTRVRRPLPGRWKSLEPLITVILAGQGRLLRTRQAQGEGKLLEDAHPHPEPVEGREAAAGRQGRGRPLYQRSLALTLMFVIAELDPRLSGSARDDLFPLFLDGRGEKRSERIYQRERPDKAPIPVPGVRDSWHMLGGKSPALPIGQTLQSLAASTLELNRTAVDHVRARHVRTKVPWDGYYFSGPKSFRPGRAPAGRSGGPRSGAS